MILNLSRVCAIWSQSESKSLTASITAKKQEYDLATNRVMAEGEVHMDYEGMHLRADKMEVDMKTESIDASGNVKVEMDTSLLPEAKKKPSRKHSSDRNAALAERLQGKTPVLEGDRFHYEFGMKSGTLDNAKVSFDRIIFRGTQIKLSAAELTVLNSTVTTCERETDMHYRLTCRSVRVRPGRDVLLRHVSLWLGDHKVISVSKHVFSLQKKKAVHTLMPGAHFNTTDGVLIQSLVVYPLSDSASDASVGFDAGLSAKHGFRGGTYVNGSTDSLDYGVRLAAKDVYNEDLSSRILVDKTPEVYLNAVDFPLGDRLSADVFTSAGNYQEQEPTGASSQRTNVSVRLTPDFGTREHPSPFFGSVIARKTWYDDGMEYSVLGAQMGVGGYLSKRLYTSVEYITHRITGATPFEFDDIDISHEAKLVTEVAVNKKWKVPLQFRYDLDQGSFRSTKYGLLRTLDCLEYGGSFDTSRGEFSLEVRLVGFDQRQRR